MAVSDAGTALIFPTCPQGIRLEARLIRVGDEEALLEAERPYLAAAAVKVRRQSGAARRAARELLGREGLADCALPPDANGVPVWPPEFVGSLAHDDHLAMAAIAPRSTYAAIGVDVEPDLPLPVDIALKVATRAEAARLAPAVLESRLLFCVKEAAFKAFNSLDGHFLEFDDVEVDLDMRQCRSVHGPRAGIAWAQGGHVVAVAWVRRLG